ncbi:hypothetical protein T484DRAFT_1935765 [Baffinella frigidus]|nr:hypothetical protein T484DRAFT_1935765 [Cryptophyta sp. CCMP2293]
MYNLRARAGGRLVGGARLPELQHLLITSPENSVSSSIPLHMPCSRRAALGSIKTQEPRAPLQAGSARCAPLNQPPKPPSASSC